MGAALPKYTMVRRVMIMMDINRAGYSREESLRSFGNREITVEHLTPVDNDDSADRIRAVLYEIFSKYNGENHGQ